MALHMFNEDNQGYQRAWVYTDNQAAIIFSYKLTQQLEQYIIKQILEL